MPTAAPARPAGNPPPPGWHVVWTQSHCEQLVHDQLVARGFESFLPKINVWSSRAGLRRLIRRPMFPGYLFLRHAMDKDSYLEVRKARGLVALLGETWERLAVVPEGEIESVRALARSDLPCMPHPYLREGMRVRITRGPLAGVEGVLARRRDHKGLLVLSVDLLFRSVGVEVDCTAVDPA
ncbi:MAG: NusG-like protein [Acidobacteria bacterium]|nr:NusG-like protein [Acidobacteriota bacterium]